MQVPSTYPCAGRTTQCVSHAFIVRIRNVQLCSQIYELLVPASVQTSDKESPEAGVDEFVLKYSLDLLEDELLDLTNVL